jgi:hypothetical protein
LSCALRPGCHIETSSVPVTFTKYLSDSTRNSTSNISDCSCHIRFCLKLTFKFIGSSFVTNAHTLYKKISVDLSLYLKSYCLHGNSLGPMSIVYLIEWLLSYIKRALFYWDKVGEDKWY